MKEVSEKTRYILLILFGFIVLVSIFTLNKSSLINKIIIIILLIPFVIYFRTRKLERYGFKNKGIANKSYFNLSIEYYKKNWLMTLLMRFIMIISLFSYIFTKRIIYFKTLGIMMIIYSLYGLFANYRNLSYIKDAPKIKLLQLRKRDKPFKIYRYIAYFIILLVGIWITIK